MHRIISGTLAGVVLCALPACSSNSQQTTVVQASPTASSTALPKGKWSGPWLIVGPSVEPGISGWTVHVRNMSKQNQSAYQELKLYRDGKLLVTMQCMQSSLEDGDTVPPGQDASLSCSEANGQQAPQPRVLPAFDDVSLSPLFG